MRPDKFAELASQKFNRIPVTREVLADLETPLSVYLKLAFGPNSYLFESVQGGEKWGRYSLIGLHTSTVLKLFGNRSPSKGGPFNFIAFTSLIKFL
jgi:anthranilate synthase component 1